MMVTWLRTTVKTAIRTNECIFGNSSVDYQQQHPQQLDASGASAEYVRLLVQHDHKFHGVIDWLLTIAMHIRTRFSWERVSVRHRTSVRGDQSNHCRNMAIYAVVVSVCPSVWSSRYCIETAKRSITQTKPYDRIWAPAFWCQRSWRNSNGVTPNGGAKYRTGVVC